MIHNTQQKTERRTHSETLSSADIISIDLPALLPDVTSAHHACVHRLIGSLGARKGFEHVLSVEANPGGDTAKLCIRYDPHVLVPSRIREIAEELSSSLHRYICNNK